MIKPIETEYKGYRFRSRLEAKWAVFFDTCNVKWEYEPEGFELPNGQFYLPDFLLHDVDGRSGGELYVEAKGKMSESDAEKIYQFCGLEQSSEFKVENPILIVSTIPVGDTIRDLDDFLSIIGYHGFPERNGKGPFPFNFETIDGDYFVAHPGVNRHGRFELFGDDSNYLCDRDDGATLYAFKAARQARFEHGEVPLIR